MALTLEQAQKPLYFGKGKINFPIQFFEDDGYVHRATTLYWKIILLNNWDQIIKDGKVRQIKAKNLGAGVQELSVECNTN